MSKVEIISTPPGQAPEWVRMAWIGLLLPIADDVEGGLQMGVHGGPAQNEGGYKIPTQEALDILEKKNRKAARWWYDHLPIMPSWLVFHKEVCKFIEE